MTPKQMARLGVFHIEEAILETLFQADSTYVRGANIARALGLMKSWEKSDWIVNRILYKLEEDGRVESKMSQSGQSKTGWKLSDHEKNRRADV